MGRQVSFTLEVPVNLTLNKRQWTLKFEKIIGFAEVAFAGFAGIFCILAIKTAFFPSEDTHWESPGWSLLILILIAPLSVSTAIAGLALIKRFRRKWAYQILPAMVLIGISIFFWWADKT